jgi:hypothetical protein
MDLLKSGLQSSRISPISVVRPRNTAFLQVLIDIVLAGDKSSYALAGSAR